MEKDEFIKEEIVMCEEYIQTLTKLKALLYKICYENDVSLQPMQELQDICNRKIIPEIYVNVIFPNMEIVAPLANEELELVQISDTEDVKLCQKYIKIVDLCGEVLGLLNASPEIIVS